MIFIITLLALVIERFFHWHHVRLWRWYKKYEQVIYRYIGTWPPVVILVITLLPPLLLVWIIERLLRGWVFGLFELIFGVVILLYCLGPENLWVQVYRCIQSFNKEEPKKSLETIETTFGVEAHEPHHHSFVRTIFVAANQRVFSVIFWFVILGPVGALLYRIVDLSSRQTSFSLSSIALTVKLYLEWIPVRLFGFLFALGGHFNKVFTCWKNGFLKSVQHNEQFFADCGVAALDSLEKDQVPEIGVAEREALSLIDRALIIGLVILAISVLM